MYKREKLIDKAKVIIMILLLTITVANISIVNNVAYAVLYNEKAADEENNSYDSKEPLIVEINDNEENNKTNTVIENYESIPKGIEKYYIKVNINTQTVTIYEKDENNRYSKPVKVMLCSTGTYTPKSGTYKITTYREEWLELQGNVYGKYCTQIVGNILFHSVPYLEKYNSSSLEYWEYDKLGKEASLGCIRLNVENAKWIFDNCNDGTTIEFYSSINPGPLGIPELKTISEYPDVLRNWDPTDDNNDNPWIKYEEYIKQEQNKEDKKYYNAAVKVIMNIINIVN